MKPVIIQPAEGTVKIIIVDYGEIIASISCLIFFTAIVFFAYKILCKKHS